MAITTKLRENLHRIIDKVEDKKVLEAVLVLLEKEIHQQPELTAAHKKILDGRLKAHRENPEAGEDWDLVKERIKSNL